MKASCSVNVSSRHCAQAQSSEEAGLAGQDDERRQQGKSTELVLMRSEERKIDVRNDDENGQSRDGKLAGGNQQSSG